MKIVTVKIKDLKTNLFVRKTLNQDHALFLAELILNGIKLDPIKITPEYEIIDGRHRIEAYELNNISEIEAEVVDIHNETELIAAAFKANLGGSLPPTQQDTEHTIMLLLERGEAKKRIGELLCLPHGMARRYINEVQSKVSRAKLLRAKEAVTDGGLTVAKAAEIHGVEHESLKKELSGRRKSAVGGIAEIQRNLTKTHTSLSHKNGALIRNLLEKYEEHDVTERQVRNIFAHIDQLQKRAAHAVNDWKNRFDAMTKAAKKA
ncbi:MAG: ParB N-terminal domain-containing protein [Minisyncoccia bacterium]|jgi:ParB-like chromosome segregation protein Spo0J